MLSRGEVNIRIRTLNRMPTYFEAPCFLLERAVTVHCLCDRLKVLFHLLTQAQIQAGEVGKSGYAEIKVQDME